MEIKMDLSGQDLVKIIKSCKASNVSELKIGDIEIKFGPTRDYETSLDVKPLEFELHDLELNEASTTPMPSKEEKSQEDYQESLLLMDPSEWERQAMEHEV